MSTEGAFMQPTIPRFDGHYDYWRMLMEIFFLRFKEYWVLWRLVMLSGTVEQHRGATKEA